MKRSLVYLLCAVGLVGCTTTHETAKHETAARETTARPVVSRSEGEPKLGAQAWTFNNLTFFEAVDRTASLGAHYIESFPGQNIGGGIDGKMSPDMDAATREKVLAKCKAAGVTLNSFGVTGA